MKNKELHPPNANVSVDKTKAQRIKYKQLRFLMVNHNIKFPNNKKFIKYVNGEPVLANVHTNTNIQLFTDLSNFNSSQPPASSPTTSQI